MSINREELKRMIDQIPEQDALEVFDFIEHLNMKREKTTMDEMDVDDLAKDENLIRQVQKSRNDRKNGQFFGKEQGLKYLRKRFEES